MIPKLVIGFAAACALLMPTVSADSFEESSPSEVLEQAEVIKPKNSGLGSSTLFILPDWSASLTPQPPSRVLLSSIEIVDSLGKETDKEADKEIGTVTSVKTWVKGLADMEPFAPRLAEQMEQVALYEELVGLDLASQNPTDFYTSRRKFAAPLGLVLRGGWWYASNSGASVKTGEYQSLRSSEFWDADGLYTDGKKTVDFSATGLDSEATNAALRYYGPRTSANIQYDRYLRRLDHDPLLGMVDSQQQTPGGPFVSGEWVTKEDLNVDEDYAIRVQELNAKFKGDLTDNIRWRLGVWGMRKKGERQVNAVAHCFNNSNAKDTNGNQVFGPGCHALTQRQRIDWITTELKPAFEANIGSATIEYERTMRAFDQNDQLTTREYDNFGFNGDLPYAVVPENFTQIDRLRANVLLLPQWDFYSQYYTGNTKNKFRNTNRRISGFDLRSTAWSRDGVSVTGYAKKNVQTGQLPSLLLPEENLADLRTPINYDQTIAGLKGRWRPQVGNYPRRRLLLSGGYEFRQLGRENAIFQEDMVTVNESSTTTNRMHLRGSMRWAPAFESHVRYRIDLTKDPLYGIAKNGTTNTMLPTEEHNIEFGSNWTPADNFLMTATLGVINRSNQSGISNFQEDDYPFVLTAWYAPEPKWTFSGGLALYSNSIDQDITLGGLSGPATSQWNYTGRSDTVNFGTTYAWTDRLTLTGGYEYVRGSNRFAPPALWPDLPQYSNVLVTINRWTAGIDYQVTQGGDFYLRYQLFDYEDKAMAYNSGTAHMLLTGFQAVY